MNADDGMNGESSPSKVGQSREGLNNSPKHSDCGKHCSLAVGGARPKVRNLVCNIPNGIRPHLADDSAKVNNNVLPIENLELQLDDTNASSSGINKLHNGMNMNCANGVENTNGIHNNVNYHAAVDKCPLKVRNCSNRSNNLDHLTKSNSCYHPELQHSVTRRWDETDDSSSDTGNEGEDGLSSDECCIYTYKGDQLADLPSSFFTLDVLTRGGEQGEGPRREDGDVEVGNGDRNGGSSSPEMDFLEMDFDPGPSCEQDSEEDSDCCEIRDEEVTEVYPGHAPEPKLEMDCQADSRGHNDVGVTSHDDHRNISASVVSACSSPEEQPVAQSSPPQQQPWVNVVAGSSSTIVQRSAGFWPRRDSWGHHCTSGDLCSPGEASDLENETWGETLMMWNSSNARVLNEGTLVDTRKHTLHSALYHCIMAKRLVLDKQASLSDGDESNTVSARLSMLK